MNRWKWRSIGLRIVALSLLAPGVCRADDPTPGPVWRSPPPDAAAGNSGAGQLPATAFPLVNLNRDFLAVGDTGCPTLVAGNVIWDLRKMKPVAVLKAKISGPLRYTGSQRYVMSQNGKVLALGGRMGEIRNGDLTFWSLETGEKLSEIPRAARKGTVDYLGLAGSQYALISSQPRNNDPGSMEVWDVATGKLVRRFDCPFSENGNAVTADGRYVAIAGSKEIPVYEIATGTCVLTLDPPTEPPAGPRTVAGTAIKPIYTDYPRQFSFMDLKFSPDGTQLMANCSLECGAVMVWNTAGDLAESRLIHGGRAMQWSPDGKSWLINGTTLIDRGDERVVWINPPTSKLTNLIFLDGNRLLGFRSTINKPLAAIQTIPWDEIHRLQQAMNGGDKTAALRPGQSVSIAFDFQNLRGDEAATKALLLAGITQRLSWEGIGVAEGQSTVITLHLEERAGNQVHGVPPRDPAHPFAVPDPLKAPLVTEAMGDLKIEVGVRSQPAPVFRNEMGTYTGQGWGDVNTDAAVREQLLHLLCQLMDGMPLPYYLSGDGSAMLPIGTRGEAGDDEWMIKHLMKPGTPTGTPGQRALGPLPDTHHELAAAAPL